MGGMNAWQWAEAYPDMMDGVMPVVSLPIPVSGRNLLWRRMVIDDIDGECVVPGELLAASLASRRWPADADTAAAAHPLDSDRYV